MYSNLTITIDGVDKILNKINQDSYTSEFALRETTGEFRVKIRHTTYLDSKRSGQKVERHNMELIHTVFAVSPATVDTVRKAYTVFENDFRDDLGAVENEVTGLVDWLTPTHIGELLVWNN